MADGTPGIGRMAAVVGAMSALGSSRRVVCTRRRRRRPSPHVLAAQDLLDHPPASAARAGGNGWEFL